MQHRFSIDYLNRAGKRVSTPKTNSIADAARQFRAIADDIKYNDAAVLVVDGTYGVALPVCQAREVSAVWLADNALGDGFSLAEFERNCAMPA